MNRTPELKPVAKGVKLQLGLAVLIGLIVGSALIFFVAWSSSKQRMAEQKEAQDKLNNQPESTIDNSSPN